MTANVRAVILAADTYRTLEIVSVIIVATQLDAVLPS